MGDGFTVMGGILASVPGFGPSCYRGSVCVCALRCPTFKPRGLIGSSRQETVSVWAARAAAIGRLPYVNLRGIQSAIYLYLHCTNAELSWVLFVLR